MRAVRELNGVLFREGMAKGIIVTTAKTFTSAARRESIVRTPTAERYQMKLLAFDDVVSMFRLPRQSPYRPWERALGDLSLEKKVPLGFDFKPEDLQ